MDLHLQPVAFERVRAPSLQRVSASGLGLERLSLHTLPRCQSRLGSPFVASCALWVAFPAAARQLARRRRAKSFVTAVTTEMTEVKFRVGDVGAKGMGVLATERICKGELVLVEKPILTYRARKEVIRRFNSRQGFLEDVHFMSAWGKELEAKLQLRSEAEQNIFWELQDAYSKGDRTAVGIFLTNSYPVGDDGTTGIFPRMSRFNHSCNPNLHGSPREWAGCGEDERGEGGDDDAEVLYALRDIEVGEELCLSYIGYEELIAPRAERQAKLGGKMKMGCACDVCTLSGPALERSEENRQRLQVLDHLLPQVDDLTPQGHPLIQDMVRLINEEFSGSPLAKSRFCHDVFLLARASGLTEMATLMAQKAWENSVFAHGPFSPETLRLKRYAMDPNASDDDESDDEDA